MQCPFVFCSWNTYCRLFSLYFSAWLWGEEVRPGGGVVPFLISHTSLPHIIHNFTSLPSNFAYNNMRDLWETHLCAANYCRIIPSKYYGNINSLSILCACGETDLSTLLYNNILLHMYVETVVMGCAPLGWTSCPRSPACNT